VQRYAAVWSEQSAGIALPMAAMTVGRGRGKGARGMGTYYFQVQLQIGIPEVGAGAGRLLCVETTLYAPEGSGPRVPLASTNASVPFNPEGEVRMPTLQYLITNAQLLALEQRRVGNLRLELQVRGFLPQAATGFPGAPEVTEYTSIAESSWRQQLAGLGRTLGAEMLIAFPDEPRRRVADFLREAQRLLGQRDRLRDAPGAKGAGNHQEHQRLELAGQERQALPHCGRAVGADPGRHGGPGPAVPCTSTPAPGTMSTPGPRSRR
jgi:hypothetical protein